jgi:hypothetical protein
VACSEIVSVSETASYIVTFSEPRKDVKGHARNEIAQGAQTGRGTCSLSGRRNGVVVGGLSFQPGNLAFLA